MTKKRVTKAPPAEAPPTNPLIEISEEEKWRLINQTGILQKLPSAANSGLAVVEDESHTWGDEIFKTVVFLIPFSFLLLLMEILTHRQYGREPTLEALLDRMLPGVPILSLFIFYGNRYRHTRRLQLFLFLLSITFGSRLIWIVNNANWKVNIKQCPPLATAWVLAIVALDLGPAAMSLVIIGLWVWWAGMKIAS